MENEKLEMEEGMGKDTVIVFTPLPFSILRFHLFFNIHDLLHGFYNPRHAW